jgi:hypothetical protein
VRPEATPRRRSAGASRCRRGRVRRPRLRRCADAGHRGLGEDVTSECLCRGERKAEIFRIVQTLRARDLLSRIENALDDVTRDPTESLLEVIAVVASFLMGHPSTTMRDTRFSTSATPATGGSRVSSGAASERKRSTTKIPEPWWRACAPSSRWSSRRGSHAAVESRGVPSSRRSNARRCVCSAVRCQRSIAIIAIPVPPPAHMETQ